MTLLILSDPLSTMFYKWYVEHDGSAGSFYSPDLDQAISLNPYINYSFHQLYVVFCLIGIVLVMLLIHRRSVLTLITPNKKVNWRKMGWGFLVLLIPMCTTTIIDYFLFSSDYSLNRINLEVFLKVFGLLIVFLPIQTLMEELYFRSYLMQWIGSKVSNKIFLSIIVGLINGGILISFDPYLMDLNPVYSGLSYIVIGILLTYITSKTNSLEIAIGAKFAYYLYISVLSMLGFTRYQFFPNYFSISSLYTKMYLFWTVLSFGILAFVTVKRFQGKKDITHI
ncbi:CPBP family intramembrane glutamic endopeptidase [Neobacillus drentensis]